ncbi:hypothetical protein AVEN_205055-1 [Araneus ventricosus]|uniref:Uncharacterized protein n=1 Tax=Araneus ventricosus TaxID=182803 RepID=A0A4Y2ITF6_ARAVE|nr:hypothetical protein AVEN_205055-1 [Araneus ventricosus]
MNMRPNVPTRCEKSQINLCGQQGQRHGSFEPKTTSKIARTFFSNPARSLNNKRKMGQSTCEKFRKQESADQLPIAPTQNRQSYSNIKVLKPIIKNRLNKSMLEEGKYTGIKAGKVGASITSSQKLVYIQ